MLIKKLIEEMDINFKINDIYKQIYVNVHKKSFLLFSFFLIILPPKKNKKPKEIRICQTK